MLTRFLDAKEPIAILNAISKRLMASFGERGPITLMYHSVSPGGSHPKWKWAIAFDRFRTHLDLLEAHCCQTVCIRDFAELDKFAPKTVAITFDDGYADNFPAFEELARRNMKATCFVVSSDLGAVSRWSDGVEPRAMLTADQLQAMVGWGMEIGSHTCTHCRLTEVDDEQIRQELKVSMQALARASGTEITSFAYPYGLHDARVVDLVRGAGYRFACVTRPGAGLVDGDPLKIRRLSVYAEDTAASLARKLAFADNDVGWAAMGRYAWARIKSRTLPS